MTLLCRLILCYDAMLITLPYTSLYVPSAIGMVLFEDHIGCLRDPPDTDTEQYLHHLVGFFSLMQPLMYNVPIYKLYPTPTWRKYRHHADEVLRIGQKFVDRVSVCVFFILRWLK